MAYALSDEEKAYYKDLDEHFNKHVEEFRGKKEIELQQGKRAELEIELNKLQEYLDIYQKGEVDDLELNIRFKHAKVEVLKKVLQKG